MGPAAAAATGGGGCICPLAGPARPDRCRPDAASVRWEGRVGR